jgi:hypothetical protein
MPTLGAIRAAIDNTVQLSISGLRGFNDVADVIQVPAMVVMPARDTADFNMSFGRGAVWNFDLYILVARTEASVAQGALDQYISETGPRSLRRVFYENPDLGLAGVDDAHCSGVREYGGKFQTARVDHVGAIVRLTVRTSGK